MLVRIRLVRLSIGFGTNPLLKKKKLLNEKKERKMINPFKDFTKNELLCTAAIAIGIVWAFISPEHSDSIFNKTILSVILIKLFW